MLGTSLSSAPIQPAGSQIFNSSGTFTVPYGIRVISVVGSGSDGTPGNAGTGATSGNAGTSGTTSAAVRSLAAYTVTVAPGKSVTVSFAAQ